MNTKDGIPVSGPPGWPDSPGLVRPVLNRQRVEELRRQYPLGDLWFEALAAGAEAILSDLRNRAGGPDWTIADEYRGSVFQALSEDATAIYLDALAKRAEMTRRELEQPSLFDGCKIV
jgi:hypothetical protein